MSQQPNIQTESKKNIKDSELPVPRSQGKDIPLNPLRSPDEEVFSIPSPDSGCLLYTSPSPRDRYISRMPSSA